MTNSSENASITVSAKPDNSALVVPAVTNDVDGATRLLRLAELAEELGSSRIAGEARDLASRISEGRFYVACIGQFKRGKSTLINALIGGS
jgi:ribosome biogenesis GTPase A